MAVFVGLVAAALAADLASKQWVFDSLLADEALQQNLRQARGRYAASDGQEPSAGEALSCFSQPLMPGVKLTLSTNSGVVFGLRLPRPLVAAASAITVVVMAILFASSPARAHWRHFGLALITAGALGNLYDRLLGAVTVADLGTIRCEVRDFIDCSQIGYRYIFNVADVWLVVGVGLVMILGLRPPASKAENDRTKSSAPPAEKS